MTKLIKFNKGISSELQEELVDLWGITPDAKKGASRPNKEDLILDV